MNAAGSAEAERISGDEEGPAVGDPAPQDGLALSDSKPPNAPVRLAREWAYPFRTRKGSGEAPAEAELIGLDQLAAEAPAGFDRQRLVEAVNRGGVDARMVGGRLCFLQDDVQRWLRAERAASPAAGPAPRAH